MNNCPNSPDRPVGVPLILYLTRDFRSAAPIWPSTRQGMGLTRHVAVSYSTRISSTIGNGIGQLLWGSHAMSSSKRASIVLATVCGVLASVGTAYGQICEPAPDGSGGCVPIACSDIPEGQCFATVLHLDVATGAITAVACDCLNFKQCHIEFGDASPHAVGYCPNGQPCQVVAWDTDGDGMNDHFTTECGPPDLGACCLNSDSGPIGFETCVEATEDACVAEGGVFVPVNTGCSEIEACCHALDPLTGQTICADLNRHCCILSGGVPQGPGTSCASDPTHDPCLQLCGGIAGIPCEDPGTFCKLPAGGCCCDHMGVCTPFPNGCPDVWEPVCGCDGVTYGNACEADAVGMSIAFHGTCEKPCSEMLGMMPCFDTEFCLFPEGICDDGSQLGFCAPRPNACPDVWDPVCGCNGQTYGNECEANAAGFSILHHGECGRICGGLGPYPPCELDEFCLFPEGICDDGLHSGVCMLIPTDCPDHLDPVCGCDGQTYGNECDAYAAGVSILHRGGCERFCGHKGPDPQCEPNEFCKYPPGTCGADPTVLGTCTPTPGDCPAVWLPVCGCDGVTYGNECEADRASMSILHYGECEPGSVGACCIRTPDGGFLCLELDQGSCLAEGGTHIGIGTTCTSDPAETCASYFWACCMPNGDCFDTWADYCIAVGGVPVPGASCALVDCGSPCMTDADCDDGNMCTIGLCVSGVCEYEPVPDGAVCDDGDLCTVGDVCKAGVCVGTPIPGCGSCMSNADCPAADLFCVFPPGSCGKNGIPGMCVPRPTGCPGVWDPVCGCDGQTYSNECDAHAAGVSVRHHGECGFEDCWPTDDGMGCVNAPCGSLIPEVQCVPTLVGIPSPGTPPLVAACNCMDFNECHIELKNGVPVAAGYCPDGTPCQLAGIDLDGDGIDDHVIAECLPGEVGACCLQGPAGKVVCIIATEQACLAEGGTHVGIGTTCPSDPAELCAPLFGACCLPDGLCFDLPVDHCIASGGEPLPGVSCDVVYCGPPDIGACCEDISDGPIPYESCTDSTHAACVEGGGLFHPDTTCEQVQACCFGPNACFDMNPGCCIDSGGIPRGPGTTCSDIGVCGEVCRPTDDGLGCVQAACDSLIPEVQCVPTLVSIHTPGVVPQVVACDCMDFNLCHIELENGVPAAAGYCSDGTPCQLVGIDLDGDGVDDHLIAECVSGEVGACCFDVSGSPLPLPYCVEAPHAVCAAEGGIFGGPGTTCEPFQACCMHWGGKSYCVDTDPICCAAFGGTPQGPGTTCTDGVCGQVCGGIAGIPCDDPNEFCKYPTGTCGVGDIFGTCTVIPSGCPEYYDPVCGCDGMTYGNVCEADAAGVSVAYWGECEPIFCWSNDMCEPQQYCFFHDCDAGTGVCMPRPEDCPDVWDPVCGCDGVTYPNACEAALVGVSVAHPGECERFCLPFDPGKSCSADEFCKVPPGMCGNLNAPGVCTPIPDACPEIYDPVCGCDGVTYANECFADMAGESIAYHGMCHECAGQRVLADPIPTYCPGVPKTVQIMINPMGATAVALEDTPPTGWVVVFISDDGFYDETNGKVKWGPFFEGTIPGSVLYEVIAPTAQDAIGCFDGTISLDGVNEAICGDECIESHCMPFMAADVPQPPCPQCPVGDCTTCPNTAPTGSCRDWRITLCELVGHACAWLRGCNDDLAGLTRGAYIWRHGECYCWHEVEQNWFPTDCPPPSSGLCGGAALGLGDGEIGPPDPGHAVAYLRSSRVDSRHSRAKEMKALIVIDAPGQTSAMALDFVLPTGWELTSISDGGQWDETHRKVKWGPFYDDLSRRITFNARRTGGSVISPTRVSAGERNDGRFSGTVSFDGLNQPITVKR